nr:hypothetical protein [uncultured Psychroserpens sp.]
MKTSKLIFITFLICGIIVNCSSTQQTVDLEKDNIFDKYKFDNITYNIKDKNVQQLLENHKKETKFKKGESLKTSTFTKERNRIIALIRKHQNPDFSEDKVSFEIDTTLIRNKFSVVTTIQN